jgi:DNA-binding CsgD family transcriptional regulator
VAVPGAPGERDALGELTPQQRQIVRLASDGLTNREIGDRLFLSPRTVSSHLYRSYPKLGVAGRHQLRDVIEGSPSPRTRARKASPFPKPCLKSCLDARMASGGALGEPGRERLRMIRLPAAAAASTASAAE